MIVEFEREQSSLLARTVHENRVLRQENELLLRCLAVALGTGTVVITEDEANSPKPTFYVDENRNGDVILRLRSPESDNHFVRKGKIYR